MDCWYRIFCCFSKSSPPTNNDLPVLTAPLLRQLDPPGPIKLVAFGDWGATAGAPLLEMIGKYIREIARPNAVVLLGDSAYNFGVSQLLGTKDPVFQLFSTHLAGPRSHSVYGSTPSDIPYWVVAGNHDHLGNIEAQLRYEKIDPRWSMVRTYEVKKLRIEGDKVVCLWLFDSIRVPYFVESMRRSIETQIRGCHWRIMGSHYPIHTEGMYKRDSTTIMMKQLIGQLLGEFDFHMYISGHEHSSQVLFNEDTKTVHLIAGASVSVRRDIGQDDLDPTTDDEYDYVWGNDSLLPVVLQLEITEYSIVYKFVHLHRCNATGVALGSETTLFIDSIVHRQNVILN